MSKAFISVKGVNELVSVWENALETQEQAQAEAVKDVGKILGTAVREHVWPASNLNQQDSEAPRSLPKRKPVRVTLLPDRGEVALSSYYAKARSVPVYEAMQSLGMSDETERDSLRVDLTGNGSANKTEVSFADAPRLMGWAKRDGSAPKDRQFTRHAVELPVAALERLAMTPAVRKSREEIALRFDEVQEKFVRAAYG